MGLRDLIKRTVLGRGGLGRPAPDERPAATTPASSAVPRTLPTHEDSGYRAVGFASQVTESRAGTFPHRGAVIAVFRREGRLYCIDNACAHEDGPVGEGAIAGCRVRCPYHDWEYDFTTGACLTDPERALATWAVREESGVIWVGTRLTAGTRARGGDHNDGMETIIR